MIYFACKQCGKRYERPVDACGTLLFCECGAGTRVPWESTVPPPEPGSVPIPRVNIPPLPPGGAANGPEQRQLPRYGGSRPPDPAVCLNHRHLPSEQSCDGCNHRFCSSCVVGLQGAMLCGPCKNFRLRSQTRPATLSLLALFSPMVALGAGGVWVLVLLMAAGSHAPPQTSLVLGAIGLVPQAIALIMAFAALFQTEGQQRRGGRSFAIAGMISAVACTVLTVQMTMLTIRANE